MKLNMVLLVALLTIPTLANGQRSKPDRIADASQTNSLRRLQASSSAPLKISLERGAVRFAMFNVRVPADAGRDADGKALWFLNRYAGALRLREPSVDLQLTRRSRDGNFLFFRRRHRGIPVFPGGLGVHLDRLSVRGLSGNYVTEVNVSHVPRISAELAESIAMRADKHKGHVHGDTSLRFVGLALLDIGDRRTHLAWRVHLMSDKTIYIDAHTGKPLYTSSEVRQDFDLELDTRNGDGPVTSVPCGGALRWFEEDGPVSGASPDAEGWLAFNNIRTVDSYFRNTFGRDGYDDEGDDVEIYVHTGFNQAHYAVCCDLFEFGDGWPVIDVMAHEFTHGVTFASAELEGTNENGALGESLSDIFAHFVDNDWLAGEDLPGGARRNMRDPPLINNHPDRYSNKRPGSDTPQEGNDYGNIHSNAGIHNKAAYLLIAGDTFNTYSVRGIGRAKAQQLFYAVITTHLNDSSEMIDVRNAAVYYANFWKTVGLHGFTANDLCQVRNAYAAVEIGMGDRDCNGVEEAQDQDTDGDFIDNVDDNCDGDANPGQDDWDHDGIGNACDDDMDGDGKPNDQDNCFGISNAGQENFNGDAEGDACDNSDGPQFDSYLDAEDNCKTVPNEDQLDTNSDGEGDACDTDDDGDGDPDQSDNCLLVRNPQQQDSDNDTVGDACDKCPGVASSDNRDTDNDGRGNPCDNDDDGDNVPDGTDNCPLDHNPAQSDLDGDGVGFACDANERETLKQGAIMTQTTREPFIIPVPICPDCRAQIPNLYEQVVIVEAPVDFDVRIMSSLGRSVTDGQRGGRRHVLRFQPPPHGSSALRGDGRGARAAMSSSARSTGTRRMALDKPAADEMRYYLVVTPSRRADVTKRHRISFRFEAAVRPRRRR